MLTNFQIILVAGVGVVLLFVSWYIYLRATWPMLNAEEEYWPEEAHFTAAEAQEMDDTLDKLRLSMAISFVRMGLDTDTATMRPTVRKMTMPQEILPEHPCPTCTHRIWWKRDQAAPPGGRQLYFIGTCSCKGRSWRAMPVTLAWFHHDEDDIDGLVARARREGRL